MRTALLTCCLVTLAVPAAFLAAQTGSPFAGRFSDGSLTVDLSAANDGLTGSLALGGNTYPARAGANGTSLDGTFDANGKSFAFSATLNGDTLTLSSGGRVYMLKRLAGNPLSAGPAAAGEAQPPDGYSVVSTTEFGKALAAHKPVANAVSPLLKTTLSDLARYFDAKPTIVVAYEDKTDHRSGGMTFTATLRGQAIKGLISCKLTDKDALLGVVYCKAGAPPAEWAKLIATPSGDGTAAPVPPLRDHVCPDGTGSIGFPDGWTSKSASCRQTIVIDGPADQHVTLGLVASPVTPNSTAVRMWQQVNAQNRMFGQPPMPMDLFIVPYTGPVDALNNLMPQMSQFSKKNGGPTFVLDHLKQIKEMDATLAGGKAAACEYGLTTTTNGKDVHYHCMARVEVIPVGDPNESFMFVLSGVSAPDATFTRDLPTMFAIMNGVKENAAAIAELTREDIDASNRRFQAQQDAHRATQDAFYSYLHNEQRNSVIRTRSIDDFDETIRGVRTVEDTATGERRSVDLGNVDGIVDTLNRYDPGRYIQIPLRDEADPLPPR